MNNLAASWGLSCYEKRHPRMSLSGVQFPDRLDSRLKHAGMTTSESDSLNAVSSGQSTQRAGRAHRCPRTLQPQFLLRLPEVTEIHVFFRAKAKAL